MKIIIGADIVPTQSNIEFFKNGQTDKILDEKIVQLLKEADFRLFNLEVPLTDVETPIEKQGPALIAPSGTVRGMKNLGVDLLALANNHIMDQDVQGLESTFNVLRENNIKYVGAGNSLSEAQKPYIIEKDGIKTGIYACAEHEFSIAKKNHPGANPFDTLESPDHIVKLKNECDYVIVLYHGGKEHYRYPSPELQKICRKLCDKGADLVVCQHSHCVGCREEYNGSEIVYGQGNFVFDMRSNEYWNSAVLISADFSEKMRLEYIPLEKKDGKPVVSENSGIIEGLEERSEEIKKEGFIGEKYSEFAESMLQGYINAFKGRSIIFRLINRLCGHRLKRKLSEKQKMQIINCVECEAHRELLLGGLKNEGN